MRLNSPKNKRPNEFSRRDFLRAGSMTAGAIGFHLSQNGLAFANETHSRRSKSCIVLFLLGGPSQLDTWDPKPAAPSPIRGPFQPIRTNIPGIQITENFPRMAAMAHRYAIVRSVHDEEAPIHETGHQLMQTGRLSADREFPNYGAALSYLRGTSWAIVPRPIGNTGVAIDHGQSAGFLGEAHQPNVIADSIHEEMGLYGNSSFGRSCLRARQLVERGTSFVTVNMFDTVFNKITWDCHADRGALPTTLNDYRDHVCPIFDWAYSALLEDLHQRGLLQSTLVVAMGEFGRTPRINANGGRDHWPGVWSVLFAGGGIRGGQVIGSSDRIAAEPRDRPVTPAEVAATIYDALGVPPDTSVQTEDGQDLRVVEGTPIIELV